MRSERGPMPVLLPSDSSGDFFFLLSVVTEVYK